MSDDYTNDPLVRRLREAGIEAKLTFTSPDEAVFEIPESKSEEAKKIIQDFMTEIGNNPTITHSKKQ